METSPLSQPPPASTEPPPASGEAPPESMDTTPASEAPPPASEDPQPASSETPTPPTVSAEPPPRQPQTQPPPSSTPTNPDVRTHSSSSAAAAAPAPSAPQNSTESSHPKPQSQQQQQQPLQQSQSQSQAPTQLVSSQQRPQLGRARPQPPYPHFAHHLPSNSSAASSAPSSSSLPSSSVTHPVPRGGLAIGVPAHQPPVPFSPFGPSPPFSQPYNSMPRMPDPGPTSSAHVLFELLLLLISIFGSNVDFSESVISVSCDLVMFDILGVSLVAFFAWGNS